MVVYGNRQVEVGVQAKGDANTVTIEIPSDIIKVGNTVDILVRPKDGVCWKTSHDFTTDKTATKTATAMTKVGTDTNTMKFSITNNVISFTYQNGDSANVANDSVVAVVYHRNFN